MHDSTVGVDRTSNNFIVVLEVDDYNLRLVFFVYFLPDANVMIRF